MFDFCTLPMFATEEAVEIGGGSGAVKREFRARKKNMCSEAGESADLCNLWNLLDDKKHPSSQGDRED